MTAAICFQVGSIDNDMCGISMTLGADTALTRIVDAIDDLLTCVRGAHFTPRR